MANKNLETRLRSVLQEAKRSPFDDWPRKVSERDAKRWLDSMEWDDIDYRELMRHMGEVEVDGNIYTLDFYLDDDWWEQYIKFFGDDLDSYDGLTYVREGDQFVKM